MNDLHGNTRFYRAAILNCSQWHTLSYSGHDSADVELYDRPLLLPRLYHLSVSNDKSHLYLKYDMPNLRSIAFTNRPPHPFPESSMITKFAMHFDERVDKDIETDDEDGEDVDDILFSLKIRGAIFFLACTDSIKEFTLCLGKFTSLCRHLPLLELDNTAKRTSRPVSPTSNTGQQRL
jgi:hypothetical protein